VAAGGGGCSPNSRRFSQDLPLLAQHAVLAAQPPELLLLVRRQAVGATAIVARRLDDPIPDRAGRGFILARQLLGRLAGPDQLDQPAPQLRGIRGRVLGIVASFSPQRIGVHETGASPSCLVRRVFGSTDPDRAGDCGLGRPVQPRLAGPGAYNFRRARTALAASAAESRAT
jgi:hypothetical protein